MDAARDPFVKFQAILASLPKNAVPPSFMHTCGDRDIWHQFGGVRSPSEDQRSATQRLIGIDAYTCRSKINDAIFHALKMYPAYTEVLEGLSVEHASVDIVVLADHDRQKMYVAARGTDKDLTNPWTSPRDWHNNFHVLFGYGPLRAHGAYDEYREVRLRFPLYDVYGTGHSLGGAVALQLARLADEDPTMSFARVDIFDPAVSPFIQPFTALVRTDIHAHRVPYDWASIGLAWYTSPTWCQLHTHPLKPEIATRHSLKHFLPDEAVQHQSPVQDYVDNAEDDTGNTEQFVSHVRARAFVEVASSSIVQTTMEGYTNHWWSAWTRYLSCVGARKPEVAMLTDSILDGRSSSDLLTPPTLFATHPSSACWGEAVPALEDIDSPSEKITSEAPCPEPSLSQVAAGCSGHVLEKA